MAEVPVTALDHRIQKQVENARYALDRGNSEYTINICSEILGRVPGCLAVRKLLRAAQLKQFRAKNKIVAKAVGTLVGLPHLMAASSATKKNPGKAMAAAEKALSKDPTSIAALKALAKAAFEAKLPETAVFALEGVREHAPNDIENLFALGAGYIDAIRPNEALQVAEVLLQKRPNDGRAQELMKNASVAQSIHKGKWESSSGSFRDKLKDEEQAISLEQASKIVTGEEMTRRLIQESIEKVKTEPNSLNHYRAVSQGYRQLGDYASALEWVNKARELPAGAADVTLEKQVSELRQLMVETEISKKEKQLAEDPANESLRAEIEQLQAQLSKVRLDDSKSLVTRYPNDFNYRYEYGSLLVEAGQLDDAIQQFQVSQRSPKLRVASLSRLGHCFRAKGLNDLALQQYRSAKSELTAMDDLKKDIIYQLASCYEAMGKNEEAIEEFKQIYSADIGFRDVADKINSFYTQ
jgi:tetratricopeptide (TPR) repeat protein